MLPSFLTYLLTYLTFQRFGIYCNTIINDLHACKIRYNLQNFSEMFSTKRSKMEALFKVRKFHQFSEAKILRERTGNSASTENFLTEILSKISVFHAVRSVNAS